MAAGPLLAEAIEDLRKLRAKSPERAVAERILARLQHALGKKPRPTREEQEFIVTMYETWEDARAEVKAEAKAEAVLTVLRVRGIAVRIRRPRRRLGGASPLGAPVPRLRRADEQQLQPSPPSSA